MAVNQFRNKLYSNRRDMIYDMVDIYLTMEGKRDEDEIERVFKLYGPKALADEMIYDWGLDQADDEGVPHMELNEYAMDDLVSVFEDFKKYSLYK